MPPKEILAEAIVKTVFGTAGGCSCGGYKLPENPKTFYVGEPSKSACSCGGSC